MKLVNSELTLKNGSVFVLEKGDEMIACLVRVYYDEHHPVFTPIIIRKEALCRQSLFYIDKRYSVGIIEEGADWGGDNLILKFEGKDVNSVFRPPE